MNIMVKVKVKCTLVPALRLCTGCTVHRGTRRGRGISVMPRPHFTPRKDPVPIVQEAGWAPGPVWKGEENLAPTGIWSPDRPACTQSLYWLRYPAHMQLDYPVWTAPNKWGTGNNCREHRERVENLTPTEIRSPDHPARSQLLYPLSYLPHKHKVTCY
jgi:hypothetical protein